VFDFDYWKELYENSPEDFDKERDCYIKDEIEKKYEKGSPAYEKMLAIITSVNEAVSNVEGTEARLKVMQLILTQHAEQLTEGMDKLNEAVKNRYDIQT